MKPNYENRSEWRADPSTYQHLIKLLCVGCELPISWGDYEQNGNYCETCCGKATKMAHKRRWESDHVDNIGGILRSMV